jgi:pectate lyase
MLRAYAKAYRLSQDRAEQAFLWQMARDIARGIGLGDIGHAGGEGAALSASPDCADPDAIHALLELHRARGGPAYLDVASGVAANIVQSRFQDGFFARSGVCFVDDPAPLALLCLSAAMRGRAEQLSAAGR